MAALLPALITAGGRLAPELTTVCGTNIKALAPLGADTFIGRIIKVLRESGIVSAVGAVGPRAELELADVIADVWADEGATGPENIQRGIRALREAGALTGEQRLLLCATDAVFVHHDTIQELVRVAEARPEADIIFPIVRGEVYDAQFPGSPNVYARLADGAFTGSSVQIVRPAAIERSLPMIERAFAARKSQLAMARLLGLTFTFRFLRRTLTVADAEAKVGQITGLKVYAPIFGDARIAADVDTLSDYEYARRFASAKKGTSLSV